MPDHAGDRPSWLSVVLLITDSAGNYPGSGGRGHGGEGGRAAGPGEGLLPRRLSPAEAREAQANGALLIDIRGDDQRRADGLIPGAIVVPRNVLEWRCDPASPWRHAAIRRPDQVIVLVCDEGFQSSLAAAILQRLGLRNATDIDGGFAAWRQAGLPVLPGGVVPS